MCLWEDREGAKLGHKYMGLSQKRSVNRYTAESGKGTHEQVFNCSLFTYDADENLVSGLPVLEVGLRGCTATCRAASL